MDSWMCDDGAILMDAGSGWNRIESNCGSASVSKYSLMSSEGGGSDIFERKKIRRIQLYRVRIGLESPIEYWDLNYWYKVVYYRDYDRYVGDA